MLARAGKIVRLRQKLVDAADTVKGLFGVKKEQDSAVQRLERLQVRRLCILPHCCPYVRSICACITCPITECTATYCEVIHDGSNDMPARFIYRDWMALQPEAWRPRRRAWSRRARCSATRTRLSLWWLPFPP